MYINIISLFFYTHKKHVFKNHGVLSTIQLKVWGVCPRGFCPWGLCPKGVLSQGVLSVPQMNSGYRGAGLQPQFSVAMDLRRFTSCTINVQI